MIAKDIEAYSNQEHESQTGNVPGFQVKPYRNH